MLIEMIESIGMLILSTLLCHRALADIDAQTKTVLTQPQNHDCSVVLKRNSHEG